MDNTTLRKLAGLPPILTESNHMNGRVKPDQKVVLVWNQTGGDDIPNHAHMGYEHVSLAHYTHNLSPKAIEKYNATYSMGLEGFEVLKHHGVSDAEVIKHVEALSSHTKPYDLSYG